MNDPIRFIATEIIETWITAFQVLGSACDGAAVALENLLQAWENQQSYVPSGEEPLFWSGDL